MGIIQDSADPLPDAPHRLAFRQPVGEQNGLDRACVYLVDRFPAQRWKGIGVESVEPLRAMLAVAPRAGDMGVVFPGGLLKCDCRPLSVFQSPPVSAWVDP